MRKTHDNSQASDPIKLYGVQATEIKGHDERLLLALNCDAYQCVGTSCTNSIVVKREPRYVDIPKSIAHQ